MKDKHRTKFVTKDIFKSSVIGAFTKLNPKYMMHNPVMFVVEIGFVIALLLSIFPELFGPTDGINNVRLYNIFVCVILFVTVLFANFAEAVAEARRIAEAGQREIVITGVNTGDFGRTTGERFIDLLRALDAVEGIERYRISSIEPNLLTDEIIDFCASSTKFQHHFHIPLQSGSDRILGLMRRRYTTARFADRIAAVRRRMPDAFIGIDVIVGFPGETEADFRTTCDFLTGIAPAFLHIFPFSERPGTPAVDLPGKVQASVASERVKRLEALCDRLHGDFCRRAEGTESAVLFESTMRGGMMFGFTGNYIRVKAPYERAFINRICRVRLGAMDGMHDLAGEIVRDNGETERL